MDIKENLKLIGKAGLATGRSIIIIVGCGIFLNWIFALVAFFVIKPLSIGLATTLVLGFMLAMPIAYFYVGKNYGIHRGLFFIFKEKKVALFEYIVYQILTTAKEKALTVQSLQDYLAHSSYWLQKFPKPLQFIVSFLTKKVPIYENLIEITKNQEINEKTTGMISEKVAKELDKRTPISIIAPNPKPFWILLLVNLVGMVLIFSIN